MYKEDEIYKNFCLCLEVWINLIRSHVPTYIKRQTQTLIQNKKKMVQNNNNNDNKEEKSASFEVKLNFSYRMNMG